LSDPIVDHLRAELQHIDAQIAALFDKQDDLEQIIAAVTGRPASIPVRAAKTDKNPTGSPTTLLMFPSAQTDNKPFLIAHMFAV
jgi:hypothetical protein